MRFPLRAGIVTEGPTSRRLVTWSRTVCLLPSACQTPFTSAVLTGSLSEPGIPERFKGRVGAAAGGEMDLVRLT